MKFPRDVRGAVLLAVISFAIVVGSVEVSADNWPGFHGLDRAGIAAGGELPNSWSNGDYKWRLDLKSRDVGSMAVWEGKVYLLSADSSNASMRLVCADLSSGKEEWTKAFPHQQNHLHKRNTLASSTPAVDSDHVYVAHSDREHTWVRCLDHDGNEIWSRDLGVAQSQHGFGTSPAIEGERLILNFSQQAEQMRNGAKPGVSRVIAMNRSTGETLWDTSVTSVRVCYGTPRVADGKVFCANTGDGLYALSLETGELLWRNPVFKMRCVGTPVLVDGLVIGSSGSGGGGNHLVAVRIPKAAGEKPEEVYRIERNAPYVPTPVVHDGALFMVGDAGVATCVDAATGEVQWRKRLGGNFGASPIIVGDKCLFINLDGEATVVRASRDYEVLGTMDLGGPVGASPVFVDGKLLLRIDTELVCL